MSFWQQFALAQLSVALHLILSRFGSKYLTEEEIAAADVLLNLVVTLPERIHPSAAAALSTDPADDPVSLARATTPALRHTKRNEK